MTQPQANAEKPSFSDIMGNFTDGLSHPLTLNEGEAPNWAGAIMLGLGTGLTTWVLSRLFGVKSGPSFAFSILGALAGGHFALGQQYGDYNYFDRLGGKKPEPTPEPAPAETPVETQAQSPVDKLNDTRFRWATQGATEAEVNKMLNQGSFYDRASDKTLPLTPDQINKLEQRREEMKELRYFGKRIDDMTYDDIEKNGGKMMSNLIEGEFDNFRGLSSPEDVGIKMGPDGKIDSSDLMRLMASSENPVYDKLMKKWDSLSLEQKGNLEDELARIGLEPPVEVAQTPATAQTPVQAQPAPSPAPQTKGASPAGEAPAQVTPEQAERNFRNFMDFWMNSAKGSGGTPDLEGKPQGVPPAERPPLADSALQEQPAVSPEEARRNFNNFRNFWAGQIRQGAGTQATAVSPSEARENLRRFGDFWADNIRQAARAPQQGVSPEQAMRNLQDFGAFWRDAAHDAGVKMRGVKPTLPHNPPSIPREPFQNRPVPIPRANPRAGAAPSPVLNPGGSVLDWSRGNRDSVLDMGEEARHQDILNAILGQ